MRSKPLLGLLVLLLLAPAACGVMDGPAEDATEAESTAQDEGAANSAEEGEGAADAVATADGSGVEAAAEAGTEEDLAPAATLSPEEVELIENFRPPSKGSDDALVTIYEFSDYI